MPFSDLENFKVLSEKLNFTRAAESLFMSQSTLSKSIGRLEDKLGFSLFTRNTREVELTPAGKSFYKDTVELLDMYQQAVKRAKACTKGNTLVRVGGHFANPKIYTLVDALRNRVETDGLGFEIETNARHVGSIERKPGFDDPFEDAVNGMDDIDILYGSDQLATSALILTPLYRERLSAYVSKDSSLAQCEAVCIDDLKQLKWIVTTTYYLFKWSLLDICKRHGFEPETRLRVVDSMGDYMRVRSTDEVIVLNEGLFPIAPPTEVSGLVRVELTDDDAYINVVAAHLPEKDSENSRVCIDLLKEITANW